MTRTRFASLALAAPVFCALALSGCGSSSGLTTAALTGTPAPAAQAAPVNDPTARALQVGATSARASRCGFYFDPGKLRSQFLAAEQALGASPEQMQKVQREYDYTRAAVAEAVAKQPAYCSDEQTNQIKADLNRHLAGDFTPAVKKEQPSEGLFGALSGSSSGPKPFRGTFDDITGQVQ
jgi:hypothetical protein